MAPPTNCYACQNWTDFGVLLEHQKNKMTLDICSGTKRSCSRFWVISASESGTSSCLSGTTKELLKHARKKEMEVRAKKLKHAAQDFRIAVITGEEFLVEKQILAKQDLYKFDVKDLPDTIQTAPMWMDQSYTKRSLGRKRIARANWRPRAPLTRWFRASFLMRR